MAKNSNQTFNVKEAAAYMGKDPQYVRQLLHKGTLEGIKGTAAGTDIPQWKISQQACDAYAAKSASRRTSQQGAGKAYKIRIKAEDYAEVKSLLEARGIELHGAYEANYEYQKARKAKLKAEKAAAQAAGGNGAAVDTSGDEDEEVDDELAAILEDNEDEAEEVEG